MKEKLLALLRTKFQGADDAILDRIAMKRSEGVTDESQLPAIVEGIGFQDVLTSYGDYRAGDATQTAIRNYEKRHNLKDGKPIGQSANGGGQTESTPSAIDVEALKKELLEEFSKAYEPLQEKFKSFEAAQAAAKRSADIVSAAKKYGIPESFVSKFNIAEDADLDDYMKGIKQDFSNMGFEFSEIPAAGNGTTSTEGSDIASLIERGTKEIVEQQKK